MGQKILVIDGDTHIVEQLICELNRSGYTVSQAILGLPDPDDPCDPQPSTQAGTMGYADQTLLSLVRELLAAGSTGCTANPMSSQDLLSTVRSLLDDKLH